MKHILVTLLLLTAMLQLATSQTPSSKTAESDLLRLEREWSEALPQEDVGVLGRILADDYTFTTIVGNVITKASYMEKSEDNHLLSLKTDDAKVRVYGDAAVITGRITVELINRTDVARYTNVYAKRRGRWQLVATQFTRIAER